MTLIVVGIAILVIYGLVRAGGFSNKYNPISPQKESVTLIGPLHDGSEALSLTQNLPRSMNENNGLEFSYTAWVVINDFSYGYSKNPIIFSRGSGSPKMSYETKSNVIHITQKTYKGEEVIKIRNMPAEKLFHIGVIVTQTSFDVYINGLIHSHMTLPSLPVIEEAPVQVAPSGGWKGMIGSFIYYNYALSAGEIRQIAGTKAIPNPKLAPPDPPYFSTSWWIENH